jgi:septal ring factor EnvC (AmiA/AmiB activator)
MNDTPATRKDIDDILQVLQGFVQQTDERFNQADERVNVLTFQMNERFDKIDSEIIDLKASHDRLLVTLDTLIGRIDRYETEQTARDSQFEKLLAWARKVSEKTGVPLENL